MDADDDDDDDDDEDVTYHIRLFSLKSRPLSQKKKLEKTWSNLRKGTPPATIIVRVVRAAVVVIYQSDQYAWVDSMDGRVSFLVTPIVIVEGNWACIIWSLRYYG